MRREIRCSKGWRRRHEAKKGLWADPQPVLPWEGQKRKERCRGFAHGLDPLLEALGEDAHPVIHLCHIYWLFPTDLLRGHVGMPLLQHRQILLAAPRSPSVTTLLDWFSCCVNLSLPAHTPHPEFKRGTADSGTA